MDQTALTVPAENLPATAPVVPTTFAGRLQALPAGSKMRLGIGLAALAAVIVALFMWSRQGDWRVLYANLPDRDAGAIVAQLGQMNVPYRISDGGGAIMVPADKVYDIKMKLASAGLPKASVAGFEILDNARFGQTASQERMNQQRALEGELVRTITQLDGVESARVHLAMPNQNGFFREQQKPSASVMLTLHPGRMLDTSQVAGIVHLVSSSVPELAPQAVSVVDQRGALLSMTNEAGQSLDAKQLQYVSRIENTYLDRVRGILEPVLGADNVRATVTADVDFSQSEATSEQFRPNQGNEPAAVRSAQSVESAGGGQTIPTGVPGAATNQPPTPANAPINGQAQQLQGAQTGGTGGNMRRENVTNYEVDKTVRVTRNGSGTVKRINAAVVVNHRTTIDKKGKPKTEPLSQEEIDKLTELVKEAVGFNADRGDSVKVISTPFQAPTEEAPSEVPLWQQPWVLDLLRAGAVPGALALVALGVIFGAIRPAIKAAAVPPPTEKDDEKAGAEGGANKLLDAVVDDAEALPGADGSLPALEAPKQNEALEAARRLAKENPVAVANIVREWVTGEVAA